MPNPLRVLFVGAMETEIAGLRAHYGCVPAEPIHGAYPFWTSGAEGSEVGILLTHVGETHAAIATPEAIRRFVPDAVFKVGCVGGQAEGIHQGDIVVPLAFFHSGAWITRAEGDNGPTSDAAQWQTVFGEKAYQVNRANLGGRPHVLAPDPALNARYAQHLEAQGLPFARAYVGGSNMWFFEHHFMGHVLRAQVPDATSDAWVADMESYAVAQACAVTGTPFTGLYRVSNSEYYGEAYDPAAVAGMFVGAFIETVAAYVDRIPLSQ
jgi:nucleoside phosphorylase